MSIGLSLMLVVLGVMGLMAGFVRKNRWLMWVSGTITAVFGAMLLTGVILILRIE